MDVLKKVTSREVEVSLRETGSSEKNSLVPHTEREPTRATPYLFMPDPTPSA